MKKINKLSILIVLFALVFSTFNLVSATDSTSLPVEVELVPEEVVDECSIDSVLVNINNAPVANVSINDKEFNESEIILDEKANIIFDASKSYDSDRCDSITRYNWKSDNDRIIKFDNSSNPTQKTYLQNVDIDTRVKITLTVTDTHRTTDSREFVVIVKNLDEVVIPNFPPTISVSNPDPVNEGTSVTLTAVAEDVDSNTVSCIWTIPSGISIPNTDACTISFTTPNVDSNTNYEFTVKAFDGINYSEIKSINLTVNNVVSSGGGSYGGGYIILPPTTNINPIITPVQEVLGEKISAPVSQPEKKVLGEKTTKFGFKFTKKTRLGSSGLEVKKLQELLRQYGYFKYPTNTGFFGKATQTALKAFQKDRKLFQAGYVGPLTLKVLNES